MKKDAESKLKDQMDKYIKNTKVDRDTERQEQKDVVEFLKKPEKKKEYETYERPLSQLYKFYAM